MEFNQQIELVKEYIEEANEFLDQLDGVLLQLEQTVGREPNPELIHEILSSLHTFKGNSGMMGYPSLQRYSHKLEDLFQALQSGEIRLDENLIDFFMQSAGVIRIAISRLSPEKPEDISLEKEISILERFIDEVTESETSSPERTIKFTKDSAALVSQKIKTMRVDFERLDHLMNLMGELVIFRNRLEGMDSLFKEQFGEKGIILDFSDTMEQVGKITTELHEAVMKIRMLPVRHVFMRFPRFVRDFAKEKGKQIDIRFEGEDTELDKTVIDEIGESLVHLIRNAIDHGIETPEGREAINKPRQGTILIRAYQESNYIVITVKDDGRGIEEKRLRKKAMETGLLQEGESERYDLVDLIFLPGLSTAQKVSEISGRGVGMDAVKKGLAKINGTIEVESELNVGTTFTIKLPLTLAIISALLVEVSGERYAIPMYSIEESIRICEDDIHIVNNTEVTNFRDSVLPLIRLSKTLGLSPSANGNKKYVVIVQSTLKQAGLIVDTLLGQQEIVVKPLDKYLGESLAFVGATIMGDGDVSLIMDVQELMEMNRNIEGKQVCTDADHA